MKVIVWFPLALSAISCVWIISMSIGIPKSLAVMLPVVLMAVAAGIAEIAPARKTDRGA